MVTRLSGSALLTSGPIAAGEHQLGEGATPAEALRVLATLPSVAQESRQALTAFVQLSEQADELHRYALLNFFAVAKVVKRHDKLSLLSLQGTLDGFVSRQPFLVGRGMERMSSAMRAPLSGSLPKFAAADLSVHPNL